MIEGPSNETAQKSGEGSQRSLKAVYVSDIDFMSRTFVDIRNRPPQLEDINFQFQNITFVLNTIDILAGETRYPVVRRHVPSYSTLKLVETKAEEARKLEAVTRSEYNSEYTKTIAAVEDENAKSEREFTDQLEKLRSDGSLDPKTMEIDAKKYGELSRIAQLANIKKAQQVKKFKVEKERLERVRDQGIREARRQSDEAIRKIQTSYKMWAVFIPPIPPLLVGVIVMVSRRLREREGISKSRLK